MDDLISHAAIDLEYPHGAALKGILCYLCRHGLRKNCLGGPLVYQE
jgi:hypothetical protein